MFKIDEQIPNNCIRIVGSFKYLIGTFVNQYQKVFGEICLETRRRSDVRDVCRVIVPIEQIYNAGELTEGDRLEIIGEVRSLSYLDEESNSHFKIYIHAISFSRSEEEHDINDVGLIGYVAKPPIYRVTPMGREIADLRIAVYRKSGKADFLPCVVWGRNSRFAQNLEVGKLVKLQMGRLQSRLKTDACGNDKVLYDISFGIITEIS